MLLTLFFVVLLAYSLVSRLVERTPLTAPIVFTAVGFALTLGLGGAAGQPAEAGALLTIAELGLVMLLFADASRVDLRLLRSIRALPVRLLTTGMLLTIALGIAAARLVLPELSVWEAGILAAILAPTDAGLGQAIVTHPRVPRRIREALNVEAGLNDGLSVPFLLFFIALAESHAGAGRASFLRYFLEQFGYGVALGAAFGLAGGWLLAHAHRREWIGGPFRQLGFLTIPVLCLLVSEEVGASMFIAAFVAGLAVQKGGGHVTHHSVEFVEDWGQLINLAVFFLFGALCASALPGLRPEHFLYGLLSLTLVRMLPVAIALAGAGLDRATVAFVGWFGPRGLASIVLGLVYYEHQQTAASATIGDVVVATVLMSILAHGWTAKPGAECYGRRVEALPESAPERSARGA